MKKIYETVGCCGRLSANISHLSQEPSDHDPRAHVDSLHVYTGSLVCTRSVPIYYTKTLRPSHLKRTTYYHQIPAHVRYLHGKREHLQSPSLSILSLHHHYFFLLLEPLPGCEAPAEDASRAASTASALALLKVLLGTSVDGPALLFSSTSSALTLLRFFLEERLADET